MFNRVQITDTAKSRGRALFPGRAKFSFQQHEERGGVASTTNLHEKHARTGLSVFARCEESAANIHIILILSAVHRIVISIFNDAFHFCPSILYTLHTLRGVNSILLSVGRGEGGGILFPFLSSLSSFTCKFPRSRVGVRAIIKDRDARAKKGELYAPRRSQLNESVKVRGKGGFHI